MQQQQAEQQQQPLYSIFPALRWVVDQAITAMLGIMIGIVLISLAAHVSVTRLFTAMGGPGQVWLGLGLVLCMKALITLPVWVFDLGGRLRAWFQARRAARV